MLTHKVIKSLQYSNKYLSQEISLMKEYKNIKKQSFRPQVTTRRIVEHLYFPDYSQQAQQQLLEQQGSSLTDSQLQSVMALDSQQKHRRQEQEQTGLTQVIKALKANLKLLELYMEHQQTFTIDIMFTLIKQLLTNQKHLESIKQREQKRLEEKKKRINRLAGANKVTIVDRQVFLSKTQLVNHEGYQMIIKGLERLTVESELTKILECIGYLLTFDNDRRRVLTLIEKVFTRIDEEEQNNNMSVQQMTIAVGLAERVYLMKILGKNQLQVITRVFQRIQEKELQDIDGQTVHDIVRGQRIIRIARNTALLYRLEPYVIKYLDQYSMDMKINILQNYIHMEQGTKAFIQMMAQHFIQFDQQLTYKHAIKLFTKIDPSQIEQYFVFDLHLMIQVISQQLIKHIQNQEVSLEEMVIIQQRFDFNQVYNRNYDQFLCVMFIKLNQSQKLYGNYLGYQVLDWFCYRNIHSEILFNVAQNQLIQSQEEQETITGYLQSENNDKEIKSEVQQNLFLEMKVHQLWNYTFQMLVNEKQKNNNFEAFNKQCEIINEILQKENGLIIKRKVLQMMTQINTYISLYGFKMLYSPLKIQHQEETYKDKQEQKVIKQNEYKLFELEKEYFNLKYKQNIKHNYTFNNYQFDYSIQQNQNEVLVILDNYEDSCYSEEKRQSQRSGIQVIRKQLLSKVMNNIKYIEMDYQEVITKSVKYLQNDRFTVLEHQISNQSSLTLLEEIKHESTEIQNELDRKMTNIIQLRKVIEQEHKEKGISFTDKIEEKCLTQEKEESESEDDIYQDSSDEEYKPISK